MLIPVVLSKVLFTHLFFKLISINTFQLLEEHVFHKNQMSLLLGHSNSRGHTRPQVTVR